MIVGIHQINYFPWIGYFNKIAKSDKFVYLDTVQLTDRGLTSRTPVITSIGKSSYLNVTYEKEGHREKAFSEILVKSGSGWQERQRAFLTGNYAKHPYFDDIMERISPVFEKNYRRLMDVTLESVEIVCDLLDIDTPRIMQSSLQYDQNAKKSDLMLALTKAAGGDVYLSGTGAREYMDVSDFFEENIDVRYQTFDPFAYSQYKIKEFIPGLSVLDLMFNCGIKASREMFWENLQNLEKSEMNGKTFVNKRISEN